MHSKLWAQTQRRTLQEQARCTQHQVLVCNARFVPRLAPAKYSSTSVDTRPIHPGLAGCTRTFNNETYREYHFGELPDADIEGGLSWEHVDLLVKTIHRRIPIGIAA